MTTLAPDNRDLLTKLKPFVVALPRTVRYFDLNPFGLAIGEVVDPLRLVSAQFLDLLQRLDQVTFGPEGMPMPRWVYLDGAELTGGIFGLGCPASAISSAARKLLSVPDDYDGLVPYSVYIAIPTYEEGVWFGHNLASVTSLLPSESLRGLGALTKALALKAFRAEQQVGATQWSSRALFVHTRMGSLDLETAWTPAHGDDETLTYRVKIDDAALRHLARDQGALFEHSQPTQWIRSDDIEAMRLLQQRIESGARVSICGRPEVDGAALRVPVVES